MFLLPQLISNSKTATWHQSRTVLPLSQSRARYQSSSTRTALNSLNSCSQANLKIFINQVMETFSCHIRPCNQSIHNNHPSCIQRPKPVCKLQPTKYCPSNSLRTFFQTWNHKKSSTTSSAGRAASQLRPWNSSCTPTSIRNMVWSHSSSSGPPPSFILSESTFAMTIKWLFSLKSLRMSVTKSSALSKCTCGKHSEICLKFCWERSITWKVRQKSVKCASRFKTISMDTLKTCIGKRLWTKCMIETMFKS